MPGGNAPEPPPLSASEYGPKERHGWRALRQQSDRPVQPDVPHVTANSAAAASADTMTEEEEVEDEFEQGSIENTHLISTMTTKYLACTPGNCECGENCNCEGCDHNQ
ncbi:hypothetical protein H4219_002795 [Mycoemilia scoparia]|uniref:Metallothionein n=1 Tax=Mycoemilia scoparia TaxID=417184 RepID=A0A9W8DTX7_9FUNG|nr:hypothetical protein H4219_002795 [Mycoemilia scoparia]